MRALPGRYTQLHHRAYAIPCLLNAKCRFRSKCQSDGHVRWKTGGNRHGGNLRPPDHSVMCRLTSRDGGGAAPSRAESGLERLPCEATLHLLNYLDAPSLSKCAQTHSSLHKLASTTLLWDRLCRAEFGMEGGKADYASRFLQEKRRAMANLELYVGFLDEIYFSLAGFFSLVSAFGVFPLLALLKGDNWLDISWAQVFGSFYGLFFVVVMFVALRATLLLTIFHPDSSLNRSLKYCGLGTVVKFVLVNAQVWRRTMRLTMGVSIACAVPFSIQIYADEYLSTPWIPVTLCWLLLAYATHEMDKKSKNIRANVMRIIVCAFSSSTMLLLKTFIVPQLHWAVIVSPIGILAWHSIHDGSLHSAASKRLGFRRSVSHSFTPSHWGVHTYYQHHLPVLSILLSALKLDGVIALPWLVVMTDYFCWACMGPLASLARHQTQVMFREMPIPAKLRKL